MSQIDTIRAEAEAADQRLTDALSTTFVPAILGEVAATVDIEEFDPALVVAVRFVIENEWDGYAELDAVRLADGTVLTSDESLDVDALADEVGRWGLDIDEFKEWASRHQTLYGNAGRTVWVDVPGAPAQDDEPFDHGSDRVPAGRGERDAFGELDAICDGVLAGQQVSAYEFSTEDGLVHTLNLYVDGTWETALYAEDAPTFHRAIDWFRSVPDSVFDRDGASWWVRPATGADHGEGAGDAVIGTDDPKVRKRAAKALTLLGLPTKAAYNVVDGIQAPEDAVDTSHPSRFLDAAEVLRCYRQGVASAWAVRVLLDAEGTRAKVRVALGGADTVAIRLDQYDEAQTPEDDWSALEHVDADGRRLAVVPTGLPYDHRDPLTIARALADVVVAGSVLGRFADYERRQVNLAIRQGDLDDDAAAVTVSDLWHSWEQNPHQDEYVDDVDAAGALLGRLHRRMPDTLISDLAM